MRLRIPVRSSYNDTADGMLGAGDLARGPFGPARTAPYEAVNYSYFARASGAAAGTKNLRNSVDARGLSFATD